MIKINKLLLVLLNFFVFTFSNTATTITDKADSKIIPISKKMEKTEEKKEVTNIGENSGNQNKKKYSS